MPIPAPDRNSMLRPSPRTQAVYLAVDLVLMPIAFLVPYILRYNSMSELFGGGQFPNLTEHCFVFALWGILVVIAFKRKRLYSIKRDVSIPRELLQVLVCIFVTSIAVGAVVFFAKYKFFSRPVFFGSCALLCVLLGGWRTLNRLVLKRLIKGGSLNINVLIVGAGEVGKMTYQELRKRPHWGFRTSGFLDESREGIVDGVPVLGTLADFTEIAGKHFVDEVIVTLGLESKAVSRLVTQAQAMRLGVRIVPEHLEKPLPILDVTYLGMIPLLTYKDRTPHPSKSLAKKLFDFAAALVLLVLLFPAFIILAILIK
ncbi:MAG: hypothetical protein QF662_07770, partial [Phycisphaerae bacterium]|nr:hypothetical protein [Phycisphaerae bacterium]